MIQDIGYVYTIEAELYVCNNMGVVCLCPLTFSSVAPPHFAFRKPSGSPVTISDTTFSVRHIR